MADQYFTYESYFSLYINSTYVSGANPNVLYSLQVRFFPPRIGQVTKKSLGLSLTSIFKPFLF